MLQNFRRFINNLFKPFNWNKFTAEAGNLKLESLILNIDENFLSHIYFGILRSECIIYWCVKCDCKYALLYIMSVYRLSLSVPKLESLFVVIILSTGSSHFPQHHVNWTSVYQNQDLAHALLGLSGKFLTLLRAYNILQLPSESDCRLYPLLILPLLAQTRTTLLYLP